MLIVSKFKDFYDSIANTKGIDKTIIYNRVNIVIENFKLFKTNKWYDNLPHYDTKYNTFLLMNNDVISLHVDIVGFCGKLYPVCIKETKIKTISTQNDTTKIEYIYAYDEIYELFKQCNNSVDKNWMKNFDYLNIVLKDKTILNLFFEHKIPIFYISQNKLNYSKELKLILNPILKDIGFVKLFEPYIAFQEIEMYISGVLGIDSQKIIEVSDKSKIEGHGFDYKTTFRKEKDEK
jgi:hypothetical protein